MPLTPDDVQNKRFTVVRFGKAGYDEEEVDGFLDEVESEMRRLLTESASLQSAADAATKAAPSAPQPDPPAAAEPPEEPSDAALRTLLLAQRTADEAIAQAKSEAEAVVREAKQRAAGLEQDARAAHAAALGDLARQREAVEAEIAELRGFDREYRTRLKAYLEGQLRDLERQRPDFGAKLNLVAPAAPSTPPLPRPTLADSMPTPAAPTGSAQPATPTVQPRHSAAPGAPFSSAPAPGAPTTSGALPSRPPAAGSPPVTPAFDTDVDAASDVPTGPPAQPGDDADSSVE